MNAERRVSISSDLILQRRVSRHRERAALAEPLWRRWYVPLLVAGLGLVALIVAGIAALEIVTATRQRPAHVMQPARAELGSRAEPGSHVEAGPDVELISAEIQRGR